MCTHHWKCASRQSQCDQSGWMLIDRGTSKWLYYCRSAETWCYIPLYAQGRNRSASFKVAVVWRQNCPTFTLKTPKTILSSVIFSRRGLNTNKADGIKFCPDADCGKSEQRDKMANSCLTVWQLYIHYAIQAFWILVLSTVFPVWQWCQSYIVWEHPPVGRKRLHLWKAQTFHVPNHKS